MAYFTQGMVCHETYKDKNNNWVSPDELISIDGKKFLKILMNLSKLVLQSLCQNQKKILSILREL
jgi:hypothetical protein